MIPILATGLLAVALQPDAAVRESKVLLYLDSVQVPNLKKSCLNPLHERFTAEIGKTKNVERARYRSQADYVAVVQECALTEAAPVGGAVGVERIGSETGSTTAVDANLRTTGQRSVGRVVLAVDVEGRAHEFGSGPEALPFDQAVHVAMKSLLDWIQAQPRRP